LAAQEYYLMGFINLRRSGTAIDPAWDGMDRIKQPSYSLTYVLTTCPPSVRIVL